MADSLRDFLYCKHMDILIFMSARGVKSLLPACLILLTMVACNKKQSPPPSTESKSTAPTAATHESARKQRLEWNLHTLVEAYETVGHKDLKWDEPAKSALTEFARTRSLCTESNEPVDQIIGTNCSLAVDAGCDDPMIAYLHARFRTGEQRLSAKECADALCKAATALQQSSYPDIRKFYASLRAVQQLYSAFGTNADRQATDAVSGGIKHYLVSAIKDKKMPLGEVYDACHEGLKEYRGTYNVYEEIEKSLFDHWPNESDVWLLKGEAYIEKAWNARGYKYASEVTETGWKLFRKNLAVAEEALDHAWELNPKNPRIPKIMMNLEHSQGKDRKRLETWFRRAMAVDPNNYQACSDKRYYLEPKWYGSAEEMLEFGRECVRSTNWGGHIPLILVDAHDALVSYEDVSDSAAYWKRPEVWPDLKSAFEKFFELNPDEIGYRHNYALYAYRCEQWDDLNKQLKLLGPINYAYFGGREKFDEIVRLAKQNAADSKAKKQN